MRKIRLRWNKENRMSKSIYEQTQAAISELCEIAKLKEGNIVVVGCSTSEVVGSKIGTNSNPDADCRKPFQLSFRQDRN